MFPFWIELEMSTVMQALAFVVPAVSWWISALAGHRAGL